MPFQISSCEVSNIKEKMNRNGEYVGVWKKIIGYLKILSCFVIRETEK
jgi:hypothetical protein